MKQLRGLVDVFVCIPLTGYITIRMIISLLYHTITGMISMWHYNDSDDEKWNV